MPEWEDHAKIHDGCGGVVRWVEAVDPPAVGYTGECLECGVENIPQERIIPIRALQPREAVRMPLHVREQLEWDDDDTFRHNQKRLGREVERFV